MDLTSADIARITNSSLFGSPDPMVSELIIDSRQVSFGENSAFIAIKGKNHDGHQYIDTLYRKGVKVFIVEKLPEGTINFPGAAFILAQNSINALQMLAIYRRVNFTSDVIGITGSAGKTIVKEWLSDVLGSVYPVVRSPKSYNSQIGVPLSVWKLDDKFKFGIFEAGISLPGEMERIQKIIDPNIGIITNIGDAHSENFRDNQQKAKEKLKLFINTSVIIFCSDQKIISDLILNDQNLKDKLLIDWSFKDQKARIFIQKRETDDKSTNIRVTFNKITYDLKIPFIDRASVENAIFVLTACHALGIDTSIIKKGISKLTSVAMRMELKGGINNCQLIEDFYNSDPGSLGMALEYLMSQNGRNTALILSDFMQSGREEKELYSEVAGRIKKSGVERFIGIGPALHRNSKLFDLQAKFFFSTDDFIHNFNGNDFSNEVILLKGARIFEFEKIGKLLEKQVHITVLEINLDAISHNLNELRKFLNPETRIMAMVKAFAYGAGSSEIAALLEYHRVSYLGVAYADEGADLRRAGVTMPIMVMNPDISSAGIIIEYNLEPEIFSFQSLERFAEEALKHGFYNYPVHIKIDTGMHRLGFIPGEIDHLTARLKELTCIKVISVFSHLASSEDPAFDDFTHRQAELFTIVARKIKDEIGYPFLRHLLNTSGIVRFPGYQFEMVRPGIGIYGAGTYPGISFRPASHFKTRISQVKKIPSGEPVGYGCSDVSESDRVIAILPVGYADGLSRRLGNRIGNLFIKGQKVQLIGKICMDMCMVDITGLDIAEGDEAEIFGQNISINDLAKQCDTIPYEILTSIPARVKRVFYRE